MQFELENDEHDLFKHYVTVLPFNKEFELCLAGPAKLPVEIEGDVYVFNWYTWFKQPQENNKSYKKVSDQYPFNRICSSILTYGDFKDSNEAFVRLHSVCQTGDIFHSQKCDCGYQLNASLKEIVKTGTGALFYIGYQEGRGIGLFNKNLAYILQERGFDTVEANNTLGLEDDYRDYNEPIIILKHLRTKPISLLTNNPLKVEALKKYGVTISQRIPLWGGENSFNSKYLTTKRVKNNHYKQELIVK
ncbi:MULTISPECIES: GTP cyclohydrolase II [unclassified Cytobacillus]|uniref:GTP cyclohydrolase II n=1 Tax=unclassified Cytobacillus TaxID=2675268 RepID=UPI001359590A|nr:GTP cyclohydrolase II [Cytobacillus sp. AMY 15.2]KAF0817646.1 hypothetical protein KIS4809_3463 [Bacillus sp. ZZV12-4809]MCM3092180.1 GTP cyclohydrolase II [Cytobacillus sp. AMY 15.2]